MNDHSANTILQTALDAIRSRGDAFYQILDELPAALYVTDNEGRITYYNNACIELSGRMPVIGQDSWCVTWKLYTPDGKFLPHDACPMAVALHEKRAVRGAEAIAERPDGTLVSLRPYPTPLFDDEGKLIGAVNLLVDLAREGGADYLQEQAIRCSELAKNTIDQGAADTLYLMAAKYDEQALKLSHER